MMRPPPVLHLFSLYLLVFRVDKGRGLILDPAGGRVGRSKHMDVQQAGFPVLFKLPLTWSELVGVRGWTVQLGVNAMGIEPA